MKRIMIFVAAAMMFAACGGRSEVFEAADGSVQAVHRGDKWTITGPDGREVVTDYDSMQVAEVGENGHPMSVFYYKNGRQTCLQYYSSMAVRCRGDIVDGKRDGLWQYYYENGNLQAEATYVDGCEEGPYRVFRENGVPYYIGQYTAGARTGMWEVYDPQGNLVEQKEY